MNKRDDNRVRIKLEKLSQVIAELGVVAFIGLFLASLLLAFWYMIEKFFIRKWKSQ